MCMRTTRITSSGTCGRSSSPPATRRKSRLAIRRCSNTTCRATAPASRSIARRTRLPATRISAKCGCPTANGANARALTKNGVEEVAAELSPDNSQMLFLADTNERFEPYYNTNLFLVPAAGGTPRALFPDYQYAFDQATWTPDGKSILAVVNMGVHNEIVEIDVASRRSRQLTEGEHFIPYTGWSVVPSAGQMLVQRDEPSRFGDLWTLPIGKERAPFTRVTHLFDAMERDFAIPRQEKVTWKSPDGATIEGLLFYPVDYRPGTRYPLVVQLHGGPMESDKFGAGVGLLQHYFPVLAGKGYAVFRPNYPRQRGLRQRLLSRCRRPFLSEHAARRAVGRRSPRQGRASRIPIGSSPWAGAQADI